MRCEKCAPGGFGENERGKLFDLGCFLSVLGENGNEKVERRNGGMEDG